jgi:hypothetical protein
MVSYFIGGSLGSLLGAWSWRVAQWRGVCGFALASIVMALVVYSLGRKHGVPADSPGRVSASDMPMP